MVSVLCLCYVCCLCPPCFFEGNGRSSLNALKQIIDSATKEIEASEAFKVLGFDEVADQMFGEKYCTGVGQVFIWGRHYKSAGIVLYWPNWCHYYYIIRRNWI